MRSNYKRYLREKQELFTISKYLRIPVRKLEEMSATQINELISLKKSRENENIRRSKNYIDNRKYYPSIYKKSDLKEF